MLWLRLNWRWVALNLFAVSILTIVLSQGSRDWNASHTFDPGLESGKWAIRFLLLCLMMTPLRTYFGWRSAIKLRKSAGLWSFGFAVVHVLFYINEAQLTWLPLPMPLFITLGLLGILILTALAITSNRWAMRYLKKYWKRLHRLVYLAGLSVVFHAILAATASKKIFVYDPQVVHELKLYLALLIVLLVVRTPMVRRVLKQISLHLPHRRKADLPVISVTIPDRMPECRPKINGCKASVPPDKLLIEVHHKEDVERLQVP